MTENITKQEEFLRHYYPVQKEISNYCRAITGDNDRAKDLLQETLLIGFQNIDKIRKMDSFLYFLMSTAKRVYLKQIRRIKISNLFIKRNQPNIIDNTNHPVVQTQ